MKPRSASPSSSARRPWQAHSEVFSQQPLAKWMAWRIMLGGGGFSVRLPSLGIVAMLTSQLNSPRRRPHSSSLLHLLLHPANISRTSQMAHRRRKSLRRRPSANRSRQIRLGSFHHRQGRRPSLQRLQSHCSRIHVLWPHRSRLWVCLLRSWNHSIIRL